ncbi:MAG: hypothetical protein ACJ776_07835, partial [Chloroflexota bacterium]
MAPRMSPRRDLVITAVAVIALSRLADGPLVWLIALLVLAGVAVGARHVLADISAMGSAAVPLEAPINPALAAAASIGAIRLVGIGLGLAPALLVAALLIDRALRIEERIVAAPHGSTGADRTMLLAFALVIGFIGFIGAAAQVPGGLAGPVAGGGSGLTDQGLLALALADGAL